MAAAVEPTLQELATKFCDSEDEVDVPSANETAENELPDARSLPDSAATETEATAAAAANEEYEEEEDYGDEDGWDSDDEELASAMEWADLRDGKKEKNFFFCS